MDHSLALATTKAEVKDGASSLLPTKCTPSTVPPNVDGECILGGIRVPLQKEGYRPTTALNAGNRCVAYPVYLMRNVPYTRGKIVGSNYTALANAYEATRLNQKWAERTPVEW